MPRTSGFYPKYSQKQPIQKQKCSEWAVFSSLYTVSNHQTLVYLPELSAACMNLKKLEKMKAKKALLAKKIQEVLCLQSDMLFYSIL